MTTFPGVYIQEMSGLPMIQSVETSVAAFVGDFPRGPVDRPVLVTGWADHRARFGDDPSRETCDAVRLYFENGGAQACVVRVTGRGAATASLTIPASGHPATPCLTLEAANPGAWGNGLRVRIEPGRDETRFSLDIREASEPAARIAIHDLAIPAHGAAPEELAAVTARADSVIMRIAHVEPGTTPALSGSWTGSHPGDVVTVVRAARLLVREVSASGTQHEREIRFEGGAGLPLATLAPRMQAAIRAASPDRPAWASATVTPFFGKLRLLAEDGPGDTILHVRRASSNRAAAQLRLTPATGAAFNPREFALGASPRAGRSRLGADGDPPTPADLGGDPSAGSGLFRLDGVETFGLLCIPSAASFGDAALPLIATAQTYCESRRTFLLLDTPGTVRSVSDMLDYKARLAPSPNAALFTPRFWITDPAGGPQRQRGACGAIAGLCARTDRARGVWKAPAGSEATLAGVERLEIEIRAIDQDALNPHAVNALRTMPGRGIVCWGSRTLAGADQNASEWKYIPVRRTALMIEESVLRGTQWAVFEPAGAALLARVRSSVETFLMSLFRQGALQGAKADEAFFVHADLERIRQGDPPAAILITIGFAPIKPAEFVILRVRHAIASL